MGKDKDKISDVPEMENTETVNEPGDTKKSEAASVNSPDTGKGSGITINIPRELEEKLAGEFNLNDIGKIDLREAERIANEDAYFLTEDELKEGLEKIEVIPDDGLYAGDPGIKSEVKSEIIEEKKKKPEVHVVPAKEQEEPAVAEIDSVVDITDEIGDFEGKAYEEYVRAEKARIKAQEGPLDELVDLNLDDISIEQNDDTMPETKEKVEPHVPTEEIAVKDRVRQYEVEAIKEALRDLDTEDEKVLSEEPVEDDIALTEPEPAVAGEDSEMVYYDEEDIIPPSECKESISVEATGLREGDFIDFGEVDSLLPDGIDEVHEASGGEAVSAVGVETEIARPYAGDSPGEEEQDSDDLKYTDDDLDFVDSAIFEEEYSRYISEIDNFHVISRENVFRLFGLNDSDIKLIEDNMYNEEYKNIDLDEMFQKARAELYKSGIALDEKNFRYIMSRVNSLDESERESIEEDISSEGALIFEENVNLIRTLLGLPEEEIDEIEDEMTGLDGVEGDVGKLAEEGDEETSVVMSTDEGKVVLIDSELDLDKFVREFSRYKQNDMRRLLKYFDGLLDDLPDSAIKNFTESEFYALYRKVLDDMGV
ncbi:hypothetical protein ACFL20_03885 [Spirochaetota bacterium]